MTEERLYTPAEASHELGVSKARVYRLIERGRLRVVHPAHRGRTLTGRITTRPALLLAEDVDREREARS